MKRTRLFDVLRSNRLKLTDARFNSSPEPNPFIQKRGKMALMIDLSDEDDGMDDYVRGRGSRQGLDKVSRSHTGPHSGVMGSRYDDMVRDIDDLDYDDSRNPHTVNGVDDYFDGEEDDRMHMSNDDPSYRRNEFNSEDDIEDFDADAGWEFMRQLAGEEPEADEEELPEADEDGIDDEEDPNQGDLSQGDMTQGDLSQPEMGDEEGEPEEPSKFEGIVRSVKGAVLVSKRQQPDETYTEVWMFNAGKKYQDEANVRKSILSGTDIDPTKNFSEDGSQEAVITTVGNIQYITLVGIPD